ncbi:uncharacterized protein PG998_010216 [Apiospora kogelbergensis]|uniref:GED domain-containing protein n=1 Tax=Apiospora kogelbergensis TaxID=1337665 RepID=A0AAW0RA80_9PEZI
MNPDWLLLTGHCGTTALKKRLRELLMDISSQEMPHVKTDIEKSLHACKGKLDAMGPSRADEQSQRLNLTKLAFRYQNVTEAALKGYYAGDELFWNNSDLKLVTKMVKLNEDFSNILKDRGHMLSFGLKSPSDDDEGLLGFNKDDGFCWETASFKYSELSEVLQGESYKCAAASVNPVMDLIRDVFASSRGPELETFGGNVLATAFRKQTVRWEFIVLAHTSRAIVLVHDYIFNLLSQLCPEKQGRQQLWKAHLIDKLCASYRRAMDHARLLLRIERGGRPSTFNQFFDTHIQRRRNERMAKALAGKAKGNGNKRVCLDDVRSQAQEKQKADQVCEDIHYILISYYQMSRKRFVDVVCQQVVMHFLLEGEESPLQILGPDFVMGLDADQLESIAGEEPESKRQRQSLERQKEKWEAALKVVRHCT